INRTYRRSGTLWEGRFRSCLIDQDNYLLACMRYIELNPVRAGMVAEPGQYRWSSYLGNAEGKVDAVLSPHDLYVAFGKDASERQAAYRELFREELDPVAVGAIRSATNGNFALGNPRFAADIERALGRRVVAGVSGRPKKMPEPESGDLLQ
ncbi:MAG: transposase, partial [Rhodocyclaceae bacterium]|nr:transposase [Rhodocyclaceae bacterium]